jgi:hypothetical protein
METTVSDSAGELEKVLRNMQSRFVPIASRAVAVCLETIKEIWQVYPPQPARDRAKSFNTYVRGVGRYPRSSFVQNAKFAGGYKLRRTKPGRISMTSERMDTRFNMQVHPGEIEVTGRLSNDASYAPYVIGPKDGDPHQAPFHTVTGWITSTDALDQAMPEIDRIEEEAVSKFMDAIRG